MRNGDAASGYHTIKIAGLPQGNYELAYLNGNRFVRQNIEVLKGTTWEVSDNFILKDNSLIERLTVGKLPCISKVKLVEAANKAESSITVEVDHCSKNALMLLVGTHFVSPGLNQFGSRLFEMMLPDFSMSKFRFAKWNNLYQSNRELSDEIRYVFDRRKLETQTGNLLERPSLLLKRNFV